MAIQHDVDTNCNDLIRIEVSVNGHKFHMMEKTVNTQQDWNMFQDRVIVNLRMLKLVDISRFSYNEDEGLPHS